MGQDCRSRICHLKLDTQDPGHMVFVTCSIAFQANSHVIY